MAAFERGASGAAVLLSDVEPDARDAEAGTRGAGGDWTLRIDAEAETSIFAELEQLAADGARFTAISEERGAVAYGSRQPTVVIDPIDGSVNAKRDLVHHAVSIALADGPTVADVVAGYVRDLGTGQVFTARRGQGAQVDGVPTNAKERRHPDGRLELLAIEMSDSRALAVRAPDLAEIAFRWRIFGSIAVAVCQVAAGRVDAMVNLTKCRALDVAAAQIIAQESGCLVSFPGTAGPQEVPLDLSKSSAIAVGGSPQVLGALNFAPPF